MSPFAADAKPTALELGCCCHCGSPAVLSDWLERLKVSVCSKCSKRYEQLISKSNAKDMYMLSDGDIQPLGFLEKQNPHHQKFAPMRQYLVSQVEALAVQKFGSLSKLEDQKQQRMRGKLDKRAQKRKAAEEKQEREEQQQQRMQQAIDRYTSQHDTADRNAGAAAAVEPDEVVDPLTGKRLRRFGKGLAAVEVEDI